MAKKHFYPGRNRTKKEWLRQARKQWFDFRKYYKKSDVTCGCAYYPDEVYKWLNQFDKMDKLMKGFYKNI